MIGVLANPSETPAVLEFFELFKTPWEFYCKDRQYEVVLCTRSSAYPDCQAKLIAFYSTCPLEGKNAISAFTNGHNGNILTYNGNQLAIYGDCVTFNKYSSDVLIHKETGQPAVTMQRNGEALFVQVGYNLFREIHILLTDGQPPANAEFPTLELHIALLRDLILSAGISLLEIPPVPEGHRFIACLTHDVDHPSICAHVFDHTIFGFLYRALVGSLFNVFRRRASVRSLIRNWIAVFKLPFIYLGLARDFWDNFDGYLQIEEGLGSSFFVIPFKGTPGKRGSCGAPYKRASQYAAADISTKIRKLITAGCEIGLHGIDAWLDAPKGRRELQEVRRLTGNDEVGVRMHWLYFDARSPAVLEKIGIDYDLSSGYNDTIGYRSGTTQVYKPFGVAWLLELPLHVMDTALFFRSYLDLNDSQANQRVDRIIDNASRFGGCVTVNWHDRSIAPERLWGNFYIALVDRLKDNGAWFPTAAQAVSWFRMRRSVAFENIVIQAGTRRATIAVDASHGLPDLRLRLYSDRGKQDFPVGAVLSDRNKNLRRTIEVNLSVPGSAELSKDENNRFAAMRNAV